MNFRAYIHLILVAFSFLGIMSHQQDAPVPNQEIVLELPGDGSIDAIDNHKTIDRIKRQLMQAGVDLQTFKIEKEGSGRIVISYYSESDVASIKSVLAEDEGLALEISSDNANIPSSEVPSEDNQKKTYIKVLEIQQGSDFSAGLAGKLALEKSNEQTRFVNPTTYIPQTFDLKYLQKEVEVAGVFNQQTVLSIEESCYIIPEVRAGPATA